MSPLYQRAPKRPCILPHLRTGRSPLVEQHDFSSIEPWASVGDRAMRAYAALQMQPDLPDAGKKAIEPHVNAFQKLGQPQATVQRGQEQRG
ncbi:MAG: hypothetical protein ACI8W3_002596 [Myxococcota bacterium]|jgi:hypothetical protein